MPSDTSLESFTNLVVYTKSSFVEQTTPVSLVLEDRGATVSNITFPDLDLDLGDLGGTVSWASAEDDTLVTHYLVYFATDCNFVAVVTGSFTFVLDGATLAEVEVAVQAALVQSLRIDKSSSLTVAAIVPVSQATSVLSLAAAISQDTSSFISVLAVQLAAALGVDVAQVAASLALQSFTPANVQTQDLGDLGTIAATTTAPSSTTTAITNASNASGMPAWDTTTVRPWDNSSDNTSSKIMEDSDNATSNSTSYSDLQRRRLASSGKVDGNTTSQGYCQLVLFATLPVNITSVEMPSDTPLSSFTHLVVFTLSSLVEQSTPASHPIFDATASASQVRFTDLDLDVAELGGLTSWIAPSTPATGRVVEYFVYLASSSTGEGRSQVGQAVTIGSEQTVVVPETSLANFTHLVVYTRSSLVEQTTPAALPLSDTQATVANISFEDLDLDRLEMGSDLTWSEPEDTSLVTQYFVYLIDKDVMSSESNSFNVSDDSYGGMNSSDDSGLSGRNYFGNTSAGVSTLTLPVDTSLVDGSKVVVEVYTHFLVYTASALVEQTTPGSLLIVDAFASVSDVGLVDKELDLGEIGGTVTWTTPELFVERVIAYRAYLAVDVYGTGRSQMGMDLTPTSVKTYVPADVQIKPYTVMLVYTASRLTEQTTPTVVALSDTISVVSSVEFDDLDLDETDLGGTIIWQAPNDTQQVTGYAAYFATFGQGDCNSTGQEASVAVISGSLSFGLDGATAMQVEAAVKAALAQSLGIENSSITFTLSQVQSRRLGLASSDHRSASHGRRLATTWTVMYTAVVSVEDAVSVLTLAAAISRDTSSFSMVLANKLVAAGVDSAVVAASLVVGSFSAATVQVVAASTLDDSSNVTDVQDSDASNSSGRRLDTLGSRVRRLAASSAAARLVYAVAEGEAVSVAYWCIGPSLGFVPVGFSESVTLQVPPGTSLLNYTHFLVFAASSLVEQTTPRAHLIVDSVSSVSAISFLDKDLDAGELGGSASWLAPASRQFVVAYAVYLAAQSSGSDRSQVGLDVLAGLNTLSVPPETTSQGRQYVVVHTKSSLTEQTTPAFFAISDTIASVANVTFPDYDLDETDLGGILAWTAPDDTSQVTHYEIYFSDSEPTLAVIRGSLSFMLDGATAMQVRLAVLAALAQSLGINPSAITVTVTQVQSRRLGLSSDHGRRLATTWIVTYEAVVSTTQSASVVSLVAAVSADTSSFSTVLETKLAAAGVDSAVVAASLVVHSFSQATVQVVAASSITSTTTLTTAWSYGDNETNMSSDSDFANFSATGAKRLLAESSDSVSVLSGSLFFELGAGATSARIEAAVKASMAILLQCLSVNSASITVIANLAANSASLGKTWQVSYQVVSSSTLASAIELAMLATRQDTTFFAAILRTQLIAAGVDRAVVATTLVILKFPAAATQLVSAAFVTLTTTTQLSEDLLDEKDVISDLDSAGTSQTTYLRRLSAVTYSQPQPAVFFGRVPVGTENITVPTNTALLNFTQFFVFTKSLLVEQTTPIAHAILDAVASVSSVEFTDYDLDAFELGGIVRWLEPALSLGSERVDYYVVYLAELASGAGRSQVGQALSPGTSEGFLPPDAPLGAFTRLVIYTMSSLTEQTTPVATPAIKDSVIAVANVSFPDFDLDFDDLGGVVSWDPPLNTSLVAYYAVYLGAICVQKNSSYEVGISEMVAVVSGSLSFMLDGATALQVRIAVLAALAQALGIDASSITVTITQVQSRRLGLSSDHGRRLATTWIVTYEAVVSTAQSASVVSLAAAVSKDTSSFSTDLETKLVAAGVDSAVVAASLVVQSFSEVTVRYVAASSITGSNSSNVSSDSNVSSFNSTDSDELDRRRLDSDTSSKLYGDTTNTSEGQTNLSDSVLVRWCKGPYLGNVTVGTHQLEVLPDLQLSPYTHLLVYVATYLAEQSTPVALLVDDMSASVSGMAFQGKDLDLYDLGGNLTFVAPDRMEHVEAYYVYLAESAVGESRSQIGGGLLPAVSVAEVPPDTPRLNFTDFTIFTKSSLVEQTTPVALNILDEAARASNMSFVDEDLDEFEVGGTLYWSPPADMSEVTQFLIYLAEDFSGAGRSLLSTVPADATDIFVPSDTALHNFTHLTVFARSSLAEQTTPQALAIVDSVASVSGVYFLDFDLDSGDLGGTTVSWVLPATNLERVQNYYVYLAAGADASGGRSMIGTSVPSGVNHRDVPENTELASFTHLVVYTRSVLVEQSTPVATIISDTISPVSNVSFPDFDLDATDLGGTLTWVEPSEVALVTYYLIYMAQVQPEDSANSSVNQSDNETSDGLPDIPVFLRRTLFQTVAVGTSNITVPVNTALSNYTHFLVYSTSSFAEQTTPTSMEIADMVASVSSISFTDKDLDEAELGGDIAWLPPGDPSRVDVYRVYFELGVNVGVPRQHLEVDVPVGGNQLSISAETALSVYSHLAVYTVSTLVEQTTPVKLLVEDKTSRAFGLSFLDLDLDLSDLGGDLFWQEPVDTSQVIQYVVYFAEAIEANDSCPEGFIVTLGNISSDDLNQIAVVTGSLSFVLEGATAAQVEAAVRASLEQTLGISGSSITVTVTSAQTRRLTASKREVPSEEGPRRLGTTWTVEYQAVVSVEQAAAVVAAAQETSENPAAFTATLAAELESAGVDSAQVSASLVLQSFSPVTVEVMSAASLSSDSMNVSNDSDANATEEYFQSRRLSAVQIGPSRFCRGSEFGWVPVGTTTIVIPVETAIVNFTHLLVFSKSSLVEQTTPAVLVLDDANVSISAIAFVDRDLDAGQLGGAMSFEPPTVSDLVVDYLIFLATSPPGEGRLQVGGNLSVGTNEAALPAETSLSNFTHLVVYTRSSLVEQTTPIAFALSDVIATVTNISFPDFDLDQDDLGGLLSWQPPDNQAQVTHYVVYFAKSGAMETNSSLDIEDSDGLVRAQFGAVTVGTENITVPVDTPRVGFASNLPESTLLAIYTLSSLVEQTTPAIHILFDAAASVSGILFADKDLDPSELGGYASWRLSVEEHTVTSDRVSFYNMYLAEDTAGGNRSQIGAQIPLGTTISMVPANTPLASFLHLVVYTESVLVEQTTPVSLALIDNEAHARNITFPDLDLDQTDLGGTLDWLAPVDESHVIHYMVYFALAYDGLTPCAADESGLLYSIWNTTSSFGTGSDGNPSAFCRTLFRKLNVSSTSLDVLVDTALGNYTHFLIYTSSSFVEQTTPSFLTLFDAYASVSQIDFVDRDLDLQQLGGLVTWVSPEYAPSAGRVEAYQVYLAESSTGLGRSQIGQEVLEGTNDIALASETSLASFSHVLVYTKSSLVEQTTPVALKLVDQGATVSNITFPDLDLDFFDLGGMLEWLAPVDDTLVTHYVVYLVQALEADSVSACTGNGTVIVLALFRGSFTFALDGATADQVQVAATKAVAQALGVSAASLTVIVTQGPARRLSSPAKATSSAEARHLGATWSVSWQALVSPSEAAAIVTAAAVISQDPSSFSSPLTKQLRLAGVDSSFVDTLAVRTFSPVTVKFVDADAYAMTDMSVNMSVNATADEYSDSDNGTSARRVASLGTGSDGNPAAFCQALFGTSTVNSTNLEVPVDTARGISTRFLIYTKSSLVEQTTAATHLIFDAFASVSQVSFLDLDLDPSEIGGTVFWVAPAFAQRVQSYVLSLSDTAAGSGRSQVGIEIPAGINEAVVPVETEPYNHSYIVVYTTSSLVEQTTPTALALVDTVSVIGNASFLDFDLDETDLGGILSWDHPDDASWVTQYLVYFATEPSAANDTLSCAENASMYVPPTGEEDSDATPGEKISLGDSVDLSTNSRLGTVWCDRTFVGNVSYQLDTLEVPSDTPLKQFTHFLVYASSSLVEQTTPRSHLIFDVAASVSSVAYQGKDLDLSRVGNRLAGTNIFNLPPETARENFTHITVFTKSALVEQTTPAALAFQDEASRVSNITFIDYDLDEGEIGGNVTWLAPPDDSEVTEYLVYYSQDRFGANREFLGNVSRDDLIFLVPADTPLKNFTHLVVYARSSLAEQTTPDALVIIETIASVSNIFFVDKDLDLLELGGTIGWAAPGSPEYVQVYSIYLASGLQGQGRSLIGGDVTVGMNYIELPSESPIANFTNVLVYTKSHFVEQTTPVSLALVDNTASVFGMLFPDHDLDLGDVGGTLQWSAPTDTTHVTHYMLYFASADFTRLLTSNVSVDQLSYDVPPETLLAAPTGVPLSTTQLLVYTLSSLVEQTTPTALAILDEVASVSAISFVDRDLDPTDLGGLVSWTVPSIPRRVETYHLYLATSEAGSARSQVASGVPVGTPELAVPVDTPLREFTDLVVYTRSALVEQTTPVALNISDVSSVVSNVSLTDYDLDKTDLGGTLTWTAPSDTTGVTHYIVYMATAAELATGSSCPENSTGDALTTEYGSKYVTATAVQENISNITDSDVGQVVICALTYFGNTSVGTTELEVPVETALANYSHFLVFTKSVLTEQTTPFAHLIFDAVASISTPGFVDKDRIEQIR
ncbi:unnamed protein product [Polarella glacialis]|uniref:Uncharacterized protein n=1 Tax=Polarella glacialis TaxID=89957 RepID=A0A813FBT9_POLGL|nr:unnamed protein product [Polarella glacialis]